MPMGQKTSLSRYTQTGQETKKRLCRSKANAIIMLMERPYEQHTRWKNSTKKRERHCPRFRKRIKSLHSGKSVTQLHAKCKLFMKFNFTPAHLLREDDQEG